MQLKNKDKNNEAATILYSVVGLGVITICLLFTLGCSTVGKVNQAIDDFSASTDTKKSLLTANVPITIDVPDKILEPATKVGNSFENLSAAAQDSLARLSTTLNRFIKLPLLMEHTANKGIRAYVDEMKKYTLVLVFLSFLGLGVGLGIPFAAGWVFIWMLKKLLEKKSGCACKEAK